MPKRVQMTRQRPWRADNPDAVIVARPSRWGNPRRWQDIPPVATSAPGVDDDEGPARLPDAERRRLSVSDFRYDLLAPGIDGYPSIDEIRRDLVGRDLACWCPLDQPCHADVLLELANQPQNCAAQLDEGDQDTDEGQQGQEFAHGPGGTGTAPGTSPDRPGEVR